MAKYVSTKGSSIGARVLKDGRYAIASEVNGLNVVEIIETVEDVKKFIDTALPLISHIIRTLSYFFSSIFDPFHDIIIQNGVAFRYTEQKAKGAGPDKVFYMSEEDKNEIIFLHVAERMPQAKRELRKELKDFEYIK